MLVYRELTRAVSEPWKTGKLSELGGCMMEEMADPVFGIVKVIIWTLARRLLALRCFLEFDFSLFKKSNIVCVYRLHLPGLMLSMS